MILIIIAITAAVSIACFNNGKLFSRLAMVPYLVFHRKQWDRIITHGFVHGDYMHLIINMFVFWSFGEFVLNVFENLDTGNMLLNPRGRFLVLYFGGMIAASIYDVVKYRNDTRFSSVGASGAVSAVVFTSIFYSPMSKIYLMGVIPMPAIVFGLAYIAYESYSARHTRDRINHHAHLFGSIYGFLFPLTAGLDQFEYFINGF